MSKKDLVILAADKSMELTAKAILGAHQKLGIRSVVCDTYSHPDRDPGVYRQGPEFVRQFQNGYMHAILMMDREGSNRSEPVDELEALLDARLSTHWDARGRAIVIDPELETWIWGSDNALQQILNWKANQSIRDYVREQGFDVSAIGKPIRPKEALHQVLWQLKRPKSASVYADIVRRLSLQQCVDRAFIRFRTLLQGWFAT